MFSTALVCVLIGIIIVFKASLYILYRSLFVIQDEIKQLC